MRYWYRNAKRVEPLSAFGKCLERVRAKWSSDTKNQIDVWVMPDAEPKVLRLMRFRSLLRTPQLHVFFSEGAIAQWTEQQFEDHYQHSLMILVDSNTRSRFLKNQKKQEWTLFFDQWKGNPFSFRHAFLSFWFRPFERFLCS
jgi:hypothetical protein